MLRQSGMTRSLAAALAAVGAVPQQPTLAARLWVRWLDWPALTLFVIGMVLRIWLIFRGWPTLDSDEAIVGLMARHILSNGAHPTFYYGQHYMGALEAYIAVPFFWLLGPSQVALRLAMLTLVAPFLICMYLLGRATYGRMVGLLTLGALAVGPAYGLMREAPAIGGYQETLLFGALLSLLAYLRLRATRSSSQRITLAHCRCLCLLRTDCRPRCLV
jgi:hypothetical protein